MRVVVDRVCGNEPVFAYALFDPCALPCNTLVRGVFTRFSRLYSGTLRACMPSSGTARLRGGVAMILASGFGDAPRIECTLALFPSCAYTFFSRSGNLSDCRFEPSVMMCVTASPSFRPSWRSKNPLTHPFSRCTSLRARRASLWRCAF